MASRGQEKGSRVVHRGCREARWRWDSFLDEHIGILGLLGLTNLNTVCLNTTKGQRPVWSSIVPRSVPTQGSDDSLRPWREISRPRARTGKAV